MPDVLAGQSVLMTVRVPCLVLGAATMLMAAASVGKLCGSVEQAALRGWRLVLLFFLDTAGVLLAVSSTLMRL